MERAAIGIDVGGTGIKGAAVNTETGELLTARHKVFTPAGGLPVDIAAEVASVANAIRHELASNGKIPRDQIPELPFGITLPGVVRDGVMQTAANIDESWIGVDAAARFEAAVATQCTVVNDADAAGIAETALGAAQGLSGTTLVLTFGTGIGSALIFDGTLVPNFELGHLHLDGHPDIEVHAAAKVIEREGISLAEWAGRAERYLEHLEHVMHPDRFILGGGISRSADEYLPFARVTAPVVPAKFKNNAGILGAAWLAHRRRT